MTEKFRSLIVLYLLGIASNLTKFSGTYDYIEQAMEAELRWKEYT